MKARALRGSTEQPLRQHMAVRGERAHCIQSRTVHRTRVRLQRIVTAAAAAAALIYAAHGVGGAY
jgi:hypothetical protein